MDFFHPKRNQETPFVALSVCNIIRPSKPRRLLVQSKDRVGTCSSDVKLTFDSQSCVAVLPKLTIHDQLVLSDDNIRIKRAIFFQPTALPHPQIGISTSFVVEQWASVCHDACS